MVQQSAAAHLGQLQVQHGGEAEQQGRQVLCWVGAEVGVHKLYRGQAVRPLAGQGVQDAAQAAVQSEELHLTRQVK